MAGTGRVNFCPVLFFAKIEVGFAGFSPINMGFYRKARRDADGND
jgi:hypothetical protein